MYVDTNWIKRNFAIMNERFFNRNLPTPTFIVNNSNSYLGQCSWKPKTTLNRRNTDQLCYAIRISNRHSRNEGDFLNTLLHEMIHLYFYSIGKLNVGHGQEFQEMGRSFDKYGFNIQTRSRIRSNIHPQIELKRAKSLSVDTMLSWGIRLSLLIVCLAFIFNKDAIKVALLMSKYAFEQVSEIVIQKWIEYDCSHQIENIMNHIFTFITQ